MTIQKRIAVLGAGQIGVIIAGLQRAAQPGSKVTPRNGQIQPVAADASQAPVTQAAPASSASASCCSRAAFSFKSPPGLHHRRTSSGLVASINASVLSFSPR